LIYAQVKISFVLLSKRPNRVFQFFALNDEQTLPPIPLRKIFDRKSTAKKSFLEASIPVFVKTRAEVSKRNERKNQDKFSYFAPGDTSQFSFSRSE